MIPQETIATFAGEPKLQLEAFDGVDGQGEVDSTCNAGIALYGTNGGSLLAARVS